MESSNKISYLQQLYLLLWKNFVIQKRSLLGLILKLTIPAIFAIVFIPIRASIKSKFHENETTFDSFSVDSLSNNLPLFKNSTFAYCPNTSVLVDRVMRQVSSLLVLKTASFKTEEEMINYMAKDYEYKMFGVSILNESSTNFTYKLRFPHKPRNEDQKNTDWTEWKTGLLSPIFPMLGPRSKDDDTGGDPGYFIEGFLAAQKAIDFSLISDTNPEVMKLNIELKRFSYPPYTEDNFILLIIGMFPFIILISFICIVILTAKEIVHEKETGVKEAMKLMGMSSWVYWISWYIKMQMLLIPSLIITVISFTVQLPSATGTGTAAIINKTSPAVIAFFLFLYSSSLTTFTLMCSTFFKKSNNAAAGTAIIYFLTYMPNNVISLQFQNINPIVKILLCLINNLAMSMGVELIGIFESFGTGIHFFNLSKGIDEDDYFSMGHVFLLLFLDNFLHMLLIFYFDNLFPGEHGIAKPWNFIFLRFINKEKKIIQSDSNNTDTDINMNYFEDDSIYSSRKIGIKIKDIYKFYQHLDEKKIAIKNLSLNIYEGHITVLLGHNGAGKSTTISIITGLSEPTAGTVLINGKDIIKETREARTVLGYCPQHNLLFDDLTVYEHLKFFSKMKNNFNENEINEMLDLINLSDKKNNLSKTLSGGMKRKLSVAIAFIGGSETVILDEPSSGMDPQARHCTWNMLKKFKNEKKCTILLTTHYMDEAEYLGDRIAILSKGSLRCSGSPLFLKSKYSSSYILVLTKKQSENNEDDLIKTRNLIHLVLSIVPDAQLNSSINSEITFLLCIDHIKVFPILFEQLDRLKDDLNLISVGISASSLEQVFLKIEETNDLQQNEETQIEELEKKRFNGNYTSLSKEEEYNREFGLWIGSSTSHLTANKFSNQFNKFKSLLIKKIIHSSRNKSLFLSQLVLPIFIVCLYLLFIKYGPLKYDDSPPMSIQFNKYPIKNYVPFMTRSDDNSTAQLTLLTALAHSYKHHLNEYSNSEVLDVTKNKTNFCSKILNSIEEHMSCLGWNFEIYTHLVGTEFNFTNFIDKRVRGTSRLKITGHFSNQFYHSPPLTLNLITNTLFKHFTNSSDNTINLINHPLPRNLTEMTETNKQDLTSFLIVSGLSFAFSFLVSSFAIFLINERVSGAKHLQYLNGCNYFMFWFSSIFWDFFNYLIAAILVIGLFFAFNIEGLIGDMRWLSTAAILFIYGLAHIPQTYILSFKFKVSSSGFALLSAWNITTVQVCRGVFGLGQLTLIIIRIMTIPTLGVSNIAEVLQVIFLIFFPNYAMAQALSDMYDNHKAINICDSNQKYCIAYPNPCCRYKKVRKVNPCGDSDCLFWSKNYWSWEKPGIMKFIVFMILHFLVQFFILFLIENKFIRNLAYKLKKSESKKQHQLNEEAKQLEKQYGDLEKDSDVCEEENRVSESIQNKNKEIFIVDSLQKVYSNFMAVKGISFGMRSSECFGLLGVNGAGKTSTFKMITGDESISHGDAYIDQLSIKKDIHQFQRKLGYCPQVDPLIGQMTVLETMQLYARLKGIRNDLILKACLSLIDLLDLKEHTNRMCLTLSGGNKRKLSVAIALVGSPSIILLDEPTTGMDPKTRRTLWDCLNLIRNKGKSLILTTHGMDETEALCTKIGIMVNGELKCFGSLQHLKRRYGNGYTLLLKIVSDPKEFLMFFFGKLKQAKLKESQDGFLNIHIDDNSPKLFASLFTLIEENKTKYSIEYYVVTQTNLEQIFLSFASKQLNSNLRNFSKQKMPFCF